MTNEDEMTFNSYEKTDVVAYVFDQLKNQIVSGEWPPGSKLPSESKLASMFNVSRVSVRSAIQRLRDVHVVETFQGKGSFIAEHATAMQFTKPKIILNLSQKEFIDMMVFRETIEYKTLALASEHADGDDLQEIGEALHDMTAHIEDEALYSEADYRFHLAIAKASKNKVFYDTFVLMKDYFYSYLEELNKGIGITEDSVESHIQIFQALKKRDAKLAQRVLTDAMNRNIAIIKTFGHWSET
ncbi:LOW QUALITY PROTEIN: transcriptional regulator, GntR family [Bacillus sp. JCM 19046]|nr:LOW QUALITY PROTEIN: transcriptional regulator, GntR family [Bacillus sp. JCM 19045]GAF19077.1 LOW QUALITY PROTEIN: transcriptional regulator, GntR family [Bacillus sp. JCM 19046]